MGARKPGLLNWLELLFILPASSFLAPLALILATATIITPISLLLDPHPDPNNSIVGKPLSHMLIVFGFYLLGSLQLLGTVLGLALLWVAVIAGHHVIGRRRVWRWLAVVCGLLGLMVDVSVAAPMLSPPEFRPGWWLTVFLFGGPVVVGTRYLFLLLFRNGPALG